MGQSHAEPREVAGLANRNCQLPLAEGQRWYVARSLPRQEPRAESQLVLQGFRVFLPRTVKSIRHARKFRMAKCAVFPTYLFVALDLARDRWRSVNGTWGVASLIMQGETPQPVPSGVVENLLDLTDGEGMTRFDRGFREGLSVRVVGGPFAAAIGTLERLDANGRVRVLLEIMNQQVPVLLHRSVLEAA